MKLAASFPSRAHLLGDYRVLNSKGVWQQTKPRLETYFLPSPIGCAEGTSWSHWAPLRGDAQREERKRVS